MKPIIKQITKNILFLILIAFCVFPVNAQDNKCITDKKAQDEKFISEIIKSLDETSLYRAHLERGYRGDGIHQDWMDEMKRFGIKQVSFYMNFEVKNNEVKTILVKEVLFYPEYFPYGEAEIKDVTLLQQIKTSGFEKKLEAAALAFAKKKLLNIMKTTEQHSACGFLTQNLLDDERLPLLSYRTEFNSDQCPK